MIRPVEKLSDGVSIVGSDGEVHLAADFQEPDGTLHDIPDHPTFAPLPTEYQDAARRVNDGAADVESPVQAGTEDLAAIPPEELAVAEAHERALEDWYEKVQDLVEKGRDRIVAENMLSASRPRGETVDELRARYA